MKQSRLYIAVGVDADPYFSSPLYRIWPHGRFERNIKPYYSFIYNNVAYFTDSSASIMGPGTNITLVLV
jgi:hypothetical protein